MQGAFLSLPPLPFVLVTPQLFCYGLFRFDEVSFVCFFRRVFGPGGVVALPGLLVFLRSSASTHASKLSVISAPGLKVPDNHSETLGCGTFKNSASDFFFPMAEAALFTRPKSLSSFDEFATTGVRIYERL